MLACLPLIGLIVGGIWALCAWLGSFLPQPLAALLCAAAPWLITGFMHLDGYMDVCDAVLSRRDLETRQRILKDSHCGAFRGDLSGAAGPVPMGGISVGGGAAPLAADADTCGITSLCSTGRSDTAAHVHQPVQRHDPRAGAPVVFAAIVLAAVCGLSVLLWDSFAPLAAAVCYWLAAWYAFRQLDGMVRPMCQASP